MDQKIIFYLKLVAQLDCGRYCDTTDDINNNIYCAQLY